MVNNERLIIAGHGRSGTTPTQRLINTHPELWVTNEFCMYDYAYGFHPDNLTFESSEDYFWSLVSNKSNIENTKGYNYIDPPSTFSTPQAFVSGCMAAPFKGSTGRILNVESVLFGDKYRYYGDKIIWPEVLMHLRKDGLDFKVIYLVKDGRDNVASRIMRGFPVTQGETRDMTWAKSIFWWLEFKRTLPPESYLELRFEDFCSDINVNKLSKFLDIPSSSFSEYELDMSKAHIGHYREYVPDWRNSFCRQALDALEILEYI